MRNQTIAVVIPSYNLVDCLRQCLSSIHNTGFGKIKIIIIDDGSNIPINKKDLGSIGKQMDIEILRNIKNEGFSKSCNRGISHIINNLSNTKYILLLNNDAFLDKEYFRKTAKYLRFKPDLFSTSILKYSVADIDSEGINYYSDGTGINSKLKSNYSCLLPAAALFISCRFAKECISKFGFVFLPILGSYAEDIELSLRAVLMGKKLKLATERLVRHKISQTIKSDKKRLYLGLRNQIWIIITTWTKEMIFENAFSIIKGQMINNLIYSLKHNLLFMFAIYCDTIINLPRLMSIRKKIQSYLTVRRPNRLFMENNISVSIHIRRSRTFSKILGFLNIRQTTQ